MNKIEPQETPFVIEVGKGDKKRLVLVDEHEATTDRIWEMIDKKGKKQPKIEAPEG